MIDVNQLRKGTTFVEEGQIYKVLDYTHNKTGRGSATIRVSVRNMRTGAIRELTYNNGVRVQDISVDKRTVEYLYEDGDFLTFMDLENYEQPHIRREVLGDDIRYLTENMQMELVVYENEIIDYTLPNTVDMAVVEAEPGYAGDTANNPTKRVTVEGGFVVQVPIFVNQGDVIRIKTEDGSYVTRV
ncbi:MAG: elongation factor P [Anaerolineae bacterium]|nr:elongation factor P [Anaerolineae bacterium]